MPHNDDVPLPRFPETLPRPSADYVHLSSGGTSVLVDISGTPTIVHWGAALEDDADLLRSICVTSRPQRVSGGLDVTPRLGLLATGAEGWLGTPLLEGHRGAGGSSLVLRLVRIRREGSSASFELHDDERAVTATVELAVSDSGLVRQRATLRNDGDAPFELTSLLLGLPTPWDASELLDTTGHHLRERHPQRRDFTIGTHLRESRRGRPGADASVLLAAGRPGFGFETGLVHGIHVAWSGNHRVLAERTNGGESFLAGGELLLPGEVILSPGAAYESPWILGSWGDGLTELSARFHDEWRARPQHPTRPRPVTLNTWEAVYFDHSLDKLTALADIAAEVGVERFVLDDGWFMHRRDDTAGLGDWEVDPSVWPNGLHPLVNHVTALGMEFGLWVEPEMINPDSDLAREHPDWILRGRDTLPPVARQQQVLDLANPDAYRHIASRLHALLDEYPIAYLKWDHNRDLVDAGSGSGGAARVREQTLAVYRLLDELKRDHPGLEIENCASGGSRVDLGILDRTDRVWTSDSLDPLERLPNQRYTGLVVPPEMMGMHLTTPTVHSSRRTVTLELSAAVALFGHFGIEWDLTTTDAATRERIAAWIRLIKRIRPLIATGHPVHTDLADPALDARGIVADDASAALFVITQITSSAAYPPARVRLPGLSPDTRYRLRLLPAPGDSGQSELEWAQADIVLTGTALATVGVRPPTLVPQQAAVIEAIRV